MKQLLMVALLLLSGSYKSSAQTPGQEYDHMMARVTTYFNAKQYDSIWQLYASGMKAYLPADKNTEFFSGVMSGLGRMGTATFDHVKSGMTCYKLAFENRVMAFNFALDKDGKIAGLSITAYVPPNIPEPDRNITQLSLPFKGEWTVFWGGDTKELNQHVSVRAQKNAFDIVKTDATGKSYRTDGSTNEDYYAFGEPLLAPCDAEVVMAVDGVKDNKPGDQNPIYVPGNALMLRTAANEYILMAHFKNHSLRVHEGDKVARGQVLGLCGNSGNSSEPHLHLHMENVEDMNIATGIKCYFSKILVNGTAASDYSPVKGDKVANVH